MRRSSCPSVIRAGGLPAPKAPVRRQSSGGEGGLVVRESMCELAYSKDELTDTMKGKLKAAFKLPTQDPSKIQMFNPDLRRKSLGISKKPGTWAPAPYTPPAIMPSAAGGAMPAEEDYTFEELVLWRPSPPQETAAEETQEAGADGEASAQTEGATTAEGSASTQATGATTPVSVDGFLCRWLREHQREGVQFLFDCCMGLRDYEGEGCILADDMGLGKTLQSITILWTLMTQGMDGIPAVTHTIVACPVSLVTNWESELNTKWIKEARLRAKGIQVIAVSEAKKDEVVKMIRRFTTSRSAVLIISYETFRIHQRHFKKGAQCGLLICDEAHRLKNKETKTAVALSALPTKKRILLSGTPIQNALDEFYSMVHFANPNLLGSERDFCREYQRPILRGREPDATDKEREKGEIKSAELGRIVNQFILRRTNTLLSKHLPPKLVCVVCCSMSSLQTEMYRQFLSSKMARQTLNGGKQSMVLESINSLRKLVNHPSLVCDNGKAAKGFEEAVHLLPEETISDRRRGSKPIFHPSLGGKMQVLHQLLRYVKATSSDRFVLVSNFTQTLDLFERMCDQEGWKCCKLDGSCSIKKRTAMVEEFNDPKSSLYCFLLSSKAGGCGLNLIGGNRLVLFDPDWNPANDKQAAARVWRDGQKKRVYLYRMLAASCIEEKVFERQLSKEGLAGIATNDQVEAATFSSAQLRDLFSLHEGMPSHLYDKIRHEAEAAERALDGPADSLEEASASQEAPLRRQNGWPKETGDMHLWAHHASAASVDDEALRRAVRHTTPETGGVSFVFTLHVQGKDLKKAREEEEEERRREAAEMAELREREKANASKSACDQEARSAAATASAAAALAAVNQAASGKENEGPIARPFAKGGLGVRRPSGLVQPAKFGPGASRNSTCCRTTVQTNKGRQPLMKSKTKRRGTSHSESDEEESEEETEEEETEDEESEMSEDEEVADEGLSGEDEAMEEDSAMEEEASCKDEAHASGEDGEGSEASPPMIRQSMRGGAERAVQRPKASHRHIVESDDEDGDVATSDAAKSANVPAAQQELRGSVVDLWRDDSTGGGPVDAERIPPLAVQPTGTTTAGGSSTNSSCGVSSSGGSLGGSVLGARKASSKLSLGRNKA